jgi:hypothetical protein
MFTYVNIQNNNHGHVPYGGIMCIRQGVDAACMCSVEDVEYASNTQQVNVYLLEGEHRWALVNESVFIPFADDKRPAGVFYPGELLYINSGQYHASWARVRCVFPQMLEVIIFDKSI